MSGGGGGGGCDTTLCDKVCQCLAAGPGFFPGTPVSSTNKTDRHVITKILLKVTLNTIKQANNTSTNKNKQKQTKRTKQNKKHGKSFLLVMHIHIVDIFIEYHK